MFKSAAVHAADPDKALYDAAMAAITEGNFYLVTDVNGTKYYVTLTGALTYEKSDAGLFAISKSSGGALYDVGILIDPGTGSHFSNTTLDGDKAHLNNGSYRLDSGNNRNDWERQVFYLNEDGKFAIRSCNTAYGESSWADAGRAFWTWEIEDPEDEFAYPTPCYSYEPAFVWELEAPAGRDQLLLILTGITTEYDKYYYDPDGIELNMGTEWGQRPDWENYNKLVELVGKVLDILDKFDDEEFGPQDPDYPTLEEAEGWRAEADSLYNLVYNNVIPYKIPADGYYRIISPLRYYTDTDIKDPETGEILDTERTFVEKTLLASFENRGMYGTRRDDLANHVWKLTQHGDSIEMQNVGMQSYISFSSAAQGRVVLTDDENDRSHVVFEYGGADFVKTADGEDEEEKDIFFIRLAGRDRNGNNYMHQLGHSRGADSHKDMELSFWAPTYEMGYLDSYDSDRGTSEWYLEPVSDDDVTAMLAGFEPLKEHELLLIKNNALRKAVSEALILAKDTLRENFIQNASQLSSPNSDEAEGTNIGALIDNDGGTFWHTSWHSSNNYPRVGYDGLECHYLQISGMENMVGDCILYFREREGADNDRPTKVVLMGTNELPEPVDEPNYVDNCDGWEEIAVLTIPHTGKGEENTIPFYVENGFSYIRLFVTEVNSSFRTFWHASEIQFSKLTPNPNSQFVAMGEIALNLERIYNENCATPDDEITEEMYKALLAAFEEFNGGIVDPTELRNALAKYANATKGVVEGTNPGQWANIDIANAYNALYEEVDAYNKAGIYNVTRNHEYAVMLKAMSKSVMEQANGVKTNKWYRIMFPTEEMYDAYDFAKDGGDKTGLIEDQATMFGTFVTAANEISEEVPAPTDEDPDAVATETHLESIGGGDLRDSNRLFFMADDEIEDKDASMFRFIELPQEEADYSALFNEVMENSALALDLSTTYTRGDALITDASQLSSNASDEAEGTNIGALIDGDKGTFWHSDWHQKVKDPHYLQVALNEPVSGLVQVEITRRNTTGGGHIIHMYIQGSTDGEAWTNIGYMVTPYDGVANSVVSCQPIDLGAGSFKYLRFIIGRRSNLDVELDPFAVPSSASVYDKDWSYFHAAEFQIYPVTANKELSANAKALQDTYNALHKVVNIYREPTAEQFAAASQAYKAYKDEFNLAEGKPVLPSGSDKAPATYVLQNKATGLFVMVSGTGNQNNIYLKTIPTVVGYKALGYNRSLMSAKTIDGVSCNNLHAGESNRRFCTWSSTEYTSNSGLVICEAEVPYEAPAEFTFYKDVKPGRIADWCNSVTITPVDAPEEAVAYTAVGQYTDDNDEMFLALKAIETIEAGQPALFIYGDTIDYDAESDEVEPIKFTMSGEPNFVFEADTINGLIGTLVTLNLDENKIYFNANYAAAPEAGANIAVTPCSAILDLGLCPEVDPAGEYDFSISLGQTGVDVTDGIKNVSTALENISKAGAVYSVDGKLLKSNATLNSLKTLGKGMYIFNGVKIAVK